MCFLLMEKVVSQNSAAMMSIIIFAVKDFDDS